MHFSVFSNTSAHSVAKKFRSPVGIGSLSKSVKLSKLVKYSTVSAAWLLLGSVGAQAMLPTPASEMKNPSSAENAEIMQQNTSRNAQSTGVSNTGADAQMQASSVQSKTVAMLVGTDAQGRTTLQPIGANTPVKAGDMIEYHTYLTNNSADRIREMTVTMSIPAELELVGEVSPTSASASIDGKSFNRMPLRGNIDGVTQDIPLKYYKALSWTIKNLGLNETATVQYRATVR